MAAYMERLQRFNSSNLWWGMADRLYEKMQPKLESGKPMVVLDVGCGIGTFAGHVRRETKNTPPCNVRVIGCDPQVHLIDYAKQQFPDVDFRHQVFDVRLPVRENVDWITCIHVMPHVNPPTEVFVSNVRDMLVKGGTASFVLPNKWYDRVMTVSNWNSGYRGDPTIQQLWTPSEFYDLIRREGFVHIEIEMLGAPPRWCPFKWASQWFIVHARRPE